jgi:hypothetical protein
MKSRQVTRYWCDFCKKGSLRRHSMEQHERHCTLNPKRDCRVCAMNGSSPPPIEEMLAILPDPTSFNAASAGPGWEIEQNNLTALVEAAMPRLRELTEGCPACMMAALRQKGIPVPMGMDYKAEMESFFSDFNAEHRGQP